MDFQLILAAVIVLLTLTLISLGVYLILVFKELRETIEKINNILDTAESVINSLSSPVVSINTFLSAFTQGMGVLRSLKSLMSKEEDEREPNKQ